MVTLEATSNGQSRPHPGSESYNGKVSHIVKSPVLVFLKGQQILCTYFLSPFLLLNHYAFTFQT